MYVHCIILLQRSREPDKSQWVKKDKTWRLYKVYWRLIVGVTKMGFVLIVWWKRQYNSLSLCEVSKKERQIFLHFLHYFLSISSLKTLVCRMCRVCFPWTGGNGTCQNEKKKKKKRMEKKRERNAPPPSCTTIQKDGVITQKTSPTCFFTLIFVPDFPEHWATITTRILGPHTGYPLLRWEGRKSKCSSRQSASAWVSVLHHA